MKSYGKDQSTDVSKELELERNNRVHTSQTRRGRGRYGHMSARTQLFLDLRIDWKKSLPPACCEFFTKYLAKSNIKKKVLFGSQLKGACSLLVRKA